jgi:hypothetical protein
MFFNINNVEIEMGRCIVAAHNASTFIPPACLDWRIACGPWTAGTAFETCSLNSQ